MPHGYEESMVVVIEVVEIQRSGNFMDRIGPSLIISGRSKFIDQNVVRFKEKGKSVCKQWEKDTLSDLG